MTIDEILREFDERFGFQVNRKDLVFPNNSTEQYQKIKHFLCAKIEESQREAALSERKRIVDILRSCDITDEYGYNKAMNEIDAEWGIKE